jgi:UPF0755 protein
MDEPLIYIQEPAPLPMLPAPKRRYRFSLPKPRVIILAVSAAFVLALSGIGFVASAPASFPVETVFSVAKGESISGAAEALRAEGVIRSSFMFKALLTIVGGTRGLVAGDYYLSRTQGALGMAWRLSHGLYELKLVRVTIPEGFSSAEVADRLHVTFNAFDTEGFRRISAKYEGYLFPDTYLFLPNVTPDEVLKVMTDTYQKKIQEIAPEIGAFGKPIRDVISMASIIEEEARTEESRRMIAGILWKRLSIGMPLQVDAAFAFVNGKKASSDLTLDDLKIQSPYNTYVNKGLPPGPISNPGLASILATVTPIPSKYLYYLTDHDGVMRYAVTHDEHVTNKNKYLR